MKKHELEVHAATLEGYGMEVANPVDVEDLLRTAMELIDHLEAERGVVDSVIDELVCCVSKLREVMDR